MASVTALVDLSDLINRLTGGNSGTPEHTFFHKIDRVRGAAGTAPVAGRWSSLWLHDGFPGAPAANPGATWVNPTNATAGALPVASPGGGRQKWAVAVEAAASVAGTFLLYDRLAHVSGMSGIVTSAQTGTGTGSVSRYTSTASKGNIAFIEVYTALGATAQTGCTVSYNNESAVTKTSPAFQIGGTGFNEKLRMIPIPLAAGDQGITQINSVTIPVSTGTAGDFGVTIARPIAYLHVVNGGIGAQRDLISGYPAAMEILSDACLAAAFLANTTTIPTIYGSLHCVEA